MPSFEGDAGLGNATRDEMITKYVASTKADNDGSDTYSDIPARPLFHEQLRVVPTRRSSVSR